MTLLCSLGWLYIPNKLGRGNKTVYFVDLGIGEAQMTILQNLPFSLCEPGPEDVAGIGNYYVQVLTP